MASVSGEVKVLYSAEDRATEVGRRVQGGLKTTGKTSDSVAEQMRRQWQQTARVLQVAVAAAVALAARQMVQAFREMVSSTQAAGLEIDKFARQSGMAVHDIQTLRYAAEQAHVPFEVLAKIFPLLAKNTLEAARGNDTYARVFQRMGVTVTDGNGALRGTREVLLEMADYMSNAAIPAHEKMANAQLVLGRRGAELIPFLRQGREAIEALSREMERTGGIISAESVAIIKAFDDQSTKVGERVKGLKATMATELMVPLHEFRAWALRNMPELGERFAALGHAVGVTVLRVAQGVKGIQGVFELAAMGVLSVAAKVLAAAEQVVRALNRISGGRVAALASAEDWLRREKEIWTAAAAEREGLFWAHAEDIEEINRLIANLGEARQRMIAAGAVAESAAAGEAVETVERAERAKAAAADTWAAERERIMAWLARREMELDYEGAELRKQRLMAEYNQRIDALKAQGDYITAQRVSIALARELINIELDEAAKRREEEQARAAEEQAQRLAEAEEAHRRMNELLREEERATEAILRLNQEQAQTRRQMYQETWDMLMDSTRFMEGEAGKFAGLFLTGVKGQMDQAQGMDEYAIEWERLNDYYARRIEAIQTQTQVEVQLAWERGESELEMLRYFEAEKAAIQSAYRARDIQADHLMHQARLQGYQNNVNMVFGVLGTLAGFVDENNKIMFALEKAHAVASTLISGEQAAWNAMATVPWPANMAVAAQIRTKSYLAAAMIAATAIQQSMRGTTTSGAVAGGGAGYQYETPEEARWEPEEQRESRTININVYGSLVDHDAFAREIIPSLERAFDDGAR